MTATAVILALAALVAPGNGRYRLGADVGARRRWPALVVLTSAAAAVAVLVPPPVAVACGVLGGALAVLRRRRTRARRLAASAGAFAGALDVLVSELRVGAHPVAALARAAEHGDGPVARSLAVVTSRALLGADVAAGLRTEARTCAPAAYWERMAVCWQLAQQHGLAIAALMQAAQRDIGERERFRGRVEAGMAGARATAMILAGLPVVGVLLGVAIGADPLGFLLSGGVGGWCLMVGSGLVAAGLVWSDHIISRAAR